MSVSSVTGNGFDDLIAKLPKLTEEYEEYVWCDSRFYEPDLKTARAKKEADPSVIARELAKVEKDMQAEKEEREEAKGTK